MPTREARKYAMSGTKRKYRKPRVASERVFEQAALACSYVAFANVMQHMKSEQQTCGYNSS